MSFSVRAYIDKRTNFPLRPHIGQVRGLANELGGPGIRGKRGQTNERVLQKGYVRIVFPSRRLAKRYQSLIDDMFGNTVPTRRFRVSRKRPFRLNLRGRSRK